MGKGRATLLIDSPCRRSIVRAAVWSLHLRFLSKRMQLARRAAEARYSSGSPPSDALRCRLSHPVAVGQCKLPLEERSAKRIARAETEGYVKDQRREEDSERDQDKHKEKTIREHEWGPNQYAQYGQIRHHTSSCQVVSVIVGIDTVAEFDRVRGNGHSADK
jgi:chorismate mutase